MTKNKKSILIAVLSIITILAFAFFFAQMNLNRVDASNAIVIEDELQDSYGYNESLTLPSNAKILYQDKEYPITKSYLRYPDGNAKYLKEYTLDMYGEYFAIFETNVNEKIISAEKKFVVKKGYYNVGTASSSLAYDTLNSSFINMGCEKGLKVNLSEGDTFSFNQPINIYENTYFDLIYFNCLQFDTLCKNITVRLTDCYDSSKYVDIHYIRGNYDYETYLSVSANGGRKAGLTLNENGSVVIDSKNYSLVNILNDSNGTHIGGNLTINKTYYNFGVLLDTSNQKNIKVYVKYGNGANITLVSELNNSQIYDYGFDGFTDGNVYLTLTASGLVGVTQAPIEVGRIMDYVNGGLAFKNYCEDTTSPIFINAEDFTEGKIYAGNTPITIPVVYAYDDTGVRNGNVANYAVWFNRGQQTEEMVEVKNNTFTPSKVGLYTIEYYAVDYFGNEGVYKINLNATLKGDEGIIFVVDESKLSDIEAGTTVKFDNFTATGLNGDIKTVITIIDPKGNKTNVLSTENFTFNYAGKYSICYEYSDIIYSGEKVIEVTISPSSKPIFESNTMLLNDYYIKGYTYSIEKNKAYIYTVDGKIEVEVIAYISNDGGEYSEIADIFNIKIEADSTIAFKFACKDNQDVYIEKEVKVIDVLKDKSIDVTKYFVGNFNGIEATIDGTKISYNSDASVEFINPIAFNTNFSFQFYIEKETAPTKLDIVLTDYYNRDNVLKITFSGENEYKINDGTTRKLLYSWIGTTTKIVYANGKLNIANTIIQFTSPFTEGVCFIKLNTQKGEDNYAVRVDEICAQQINNRIVSDQVNPIIIVKDIDNVASLGQIITVSKPYAVDILSPNSMKNLSMTVTISGKTLKSTDGVLLFNITDFSRDYSIELSQYGTYSISYKYIDKYNNQKTYTPLVQVIDVEPPTIKLNNYDGSTISVGLNVETAVLDYTASDNSTQEKSLTIYLIVQDANGTTVASKKLKATDKMYTVSTAGNFTAYLYCKDTAGNFSYTSYKISVK